MSLNGAQTTKTNISGIPKQLMSPTECITLSTISVTPTTEVSNPSL